MLLLGNIKILSEVIMKINLFVVGKIKDSNLNAMIQEFIKRLSSYATINIEEINDESLPDKPNESEIKKAVEIEGEKILKKVEKMQYVIIFDLVSYQPNSVEFAKILQTKIDLFGSKIGFVIGGSYGLSDNVKKRANLAIGLSNLTFTHQMARLIVLEQIYRAFKINHNEVYHK